MNLNDLRVVRTLEVKAVATGVDDATASLGRLSTAQDNVAASADRMAVTTERSARGQTSVAGAYERLVRTLDPGANALHRFERAQMTVDRAFNQGAISMAEHGRVLDLARQKYGLLTQANDNMAKSHGLAAYQIQNVRAQLVDITMGLQGGMNPFTVMLQQVPQLMSAFGPGTGFLGILRGIGQAIPRSVAIGGLPGLAAAAVGFSVNREQEEQQEVRRSLRGVGRGSGLSPADIERLSGAGMFGGAGGLSVSQARDIATGIAGTGFGSEEGIRKSLEVAQRLRGELGASYDDTRKILVDLFGDTEKAYSRIDQTFGTATDASRQFVRSLVEQGKSGEAAMRVLGEIEPRLGKYADTTTTLGQVSQWFNRLGSDTIEKFTKSTAEAVGVTDKLGSAQETAADKAKRLAEQLERQLQVGRARSDALVAGLDVENQIARLDPLRQAIVAAQRSAGVGPALTEAEQRARSSERPELRSQRESLEAEIARQVALRNTIDLGKAFTEQSRVSTMTLETEIGAVGKAAAEIDRLRYATQARIAASQGGKAVSDELIAQIDREASAYSRLTEALRRTQLADQIRFDRSQLLRDPTDQAIATQLRPLGGIDAAQNADLVRTLRQTAELQRTREDIVSGMNELRSGSRGLTTGIFSDLRQGRNPTEGIVSALGRMMDQMFDRLVSKPLVESLIGRDGQLGSGLFGGVSSLCFDNDNPSRAEAAA